MAWLCKATWPAFFSLNKTPKKWEVLTQPHLESPSLIRSFHLFQCYSGIICSINWVSWKPYSGTESSWHRTAHILTIKLSDVPKAGSAMQTTSMVLDGSEHRPKLYVPAPEPSLGVIWERASWLGCSQDSAWDSSSSWANQVLGFGAQERSLLVFNLLT